MILATLRLTVAYITVLSFPIARGLISKPSLTNQLQMKVLRLLLSYCNLLLSKTLGAIVRSPEPEAHLKVRDDIYHIV